MKGPPRLMNSNGPAGELLKGAALQVPSHARQRALKFTGVALSMSASGTALAAGAGSLVKSVLLSVSLGALGGGAISLAVSETFSRLESAKEARPQRSAPAMARSEAPVASSTVAHPPAAAPVRDAQAPEPPSSLRVRPGPGKGGSRLLGGAVASTPAHEIGAPPPSLLEEQRRIDAARAAVARGDAAGALSTLDAYEHAYAKGQFSPEALALRVQALSASGQLSRARLLAGEFEQKYPHHPLLARVRAALNR